MNRAAGVCRALRTLKHCSWLGVTGGGYSHGRTSRPQQKLLGIPNWEDSSLPTPAHHRNYPIWTSSSLHHRGLQGPHTHRSTLGASDRPMPEHGLRVMCGMLPLHSDNLYRISAGWLYLSDCKRHPSHRAFLDSAAAVRSQTPLGAQSGTPHQEPLPALFAREILLF